jgi:hypothetical protein
VHIELWVENLQGRSLGNAMYKGDINPLKLKLFQIIVKTSKRTQHLTITNVNLLTLFKEIAYIYSQNPTTHKCKTQS